jgi:predicted nucleic acid-binding protein
MGAAMTNGAVPRVYLDANVFIAAFEHAGASSDHAWWLIRAIEDGEIFAATSELTLAEILVKPLERGQADLADGYGKMLVSGSHFEVMPVQRDILIEAASIRARRNAIRLPDALHVATAKAPA